MMRFTSVESYEKIKSEGLLGRLQFDVYRTLYEHGPMTQGELSTRWFPTLSKTVTTPRFAELEKLGVIMPVGERKCAISGNRCIEWDVTAGLPVKPVKKESKDQIIKRQAMQIESLKLRVEELLLLESERTGQLKLI